MSTVEEDALPEIRPSLENVYKYYPPQRLGPLWKRNEDGNWLLPRRTLGWQVLGWTKKHLTAFDGSGQPLKLTPEQARFILWFYEIDESGRFVNDKYFLQRLKGWGKDPLAAVISIVELIGPCRYSHDDSKGNPVGRENPLAYVQLAAVKFEQNNNLFWLLPIIIPKRTIEAFNLELQKTSVQAIGHPGRRIEPISSRPEGSEGNRPSLVILNEIHHWDSESGALLFQTLNNNRMKNTSQGRLLAITNAYVPGRGSLAEEIRIGVNKYFDGFARKLDWFYDSVEAHSDAPLDTDWAEFVIRSIAGDAYWLPFAQIASNVTDTAVPPSQYRRMWYNQIVAGEEALFSEGEWDGAARDRQLKAGDEIVLGFDGGKTDDHTALIAIRVRDRMAFKIAIWVPKERPDGSKIPIDGELVDSYVQATFRTYKVQAFYCDVSLWESYIATWSNRYREQLAIKASTDSAVGFDMRGNQKRITLSNEALMQEIVDQTVTHDRDPQFRRHALNAQRRENNYGITFGKLSRESPHKVDAYAAMLLAYMALKDVAEKGKKPRRAARYYEF